ncbi:hypothetical protein [Gluconacetobacter sacchari]|uniref:Uncharacterized protein n=1 Tax=Gluconacetobacter sacchari TaxID=92759 RepID=A0A7W4ICR3_9PROT|nr:hypothetical protein [Gluconacetobacter sacchari]MBB2160357.1 hypothetical protein [Gluconacetobacter sacchari]
MSGFAFVSSCRRRTSSVVHEVEMADRDEGRMSYMSAHDVAACLIRGFGPDAYLAVRRQIVRCMEQNLADEAVFWVRVREQVASLTRVVRRKDERLQ